MPVLYPPKIEQYKRFTPYIFLAGPIQNAPDWQSQVADVIATRHPSVNIACPRSRENWHGDFKDQVDWETVYLSEAALSGFILFWLAAPKETNLDRCYAQTTRFELAEWLTKQALSKQISEMYGTAMAHIPKIVLGIDPNFPGRRYIEQRVAGTIKIFNSLEEVCQEALRLIPTLR